MTQESKDKDSDATNQKPAPGTDKPEATQPDATPESTPVTDQAPAADSAVEEASSGTPNAAIVAQAFASETGAEAASRRPRSRLRRLLPYALVALIPALAVGLAVYFLAGSGGNGGGHAAGVVDGLIRLGGGDQSAITSYKDELPPEFSQEFPIYDGAEIVVSIAIGSEQGTSYFIVLTTPDAASEVFTYYSERLDNDPWQVEIGRSSRDFTGLRFLRPDNASVSGDITLHESELDGHTSIYVSYDDVSQAIVPGEDTGPFAPGATRPLPPGFPEDIPIYAGTDDSTVVVDTYFERGQGGRAFIVTFLTPDTQDDVIEFYTGEFRGRGWNVTDAGVLNTSFALSIDFDDGDTQSLSGSITADSFDEDPALTKVDLVVQVSGSRGN